MTIQNNFFNIKNKLPVNVKLVAVSKTKPVENILELYNAEHKIFGENRVQELIEKFGQLPKDIEWHFIGHLQTNKVKYIAPFVSMVQSIDSLRLLEEINKEALKNNKIINCLLELYISTEESKFGLNIDEAYEILNSAIYKKMQNIQICGVMGMATYTDDVILIRKEFKNLKSYFTKIKNKYFPEQAYFKEISMGMSGDYRIAVEEGSTIVRIGSLIFGSR